MWSKNRENLRETEISARPTSPEKRLYVQLLFLEQVTQFSPVLWMSVTGLGKRGPSSHFEPASQPATQAALEQASQSFLKGL